MDGHMEAESFEVDVGPLRLAGEELGEGPPVVLVHGLSATRRYVLHGSKALSRAGFQVISYDARGHGASDPAPPEEGYGYEFLSGDLAAVLEARAPGARVVAVGHSMGAHTIAALALAEEQRFAGLVFVGPVVIGTPPGAESLAHWDQLADGLAEEGVDGFLAALERQGINPSWRDTVLRFTRQRLGAHENPEAVASALREVPRSLPFDGLAELEQLDVPALVVASHDRADPAHPYGVAEEWADRLPQASLVSEAEDESPLAWQGGKLSRHVAAFCEERAVTTRLEG